MTQRHSNQTKWSFLDERILKVEAQCIVCVVSIVRFLRPLTTSGCFEFNVVSPEKWGRIACRLSEFGLT
jgi:hypothetical protein